MPNQTSFSEFAYRVAGTAVIIVAVCDPNVCAVKTNASWIIGRIVSSNYRAINLVQFRDRAIVTICDPDRIAVKTHHCWR
jgi:microcystin degradation protein MlrC